MDRVNNMHSGPIISSKAIYIYINIYIYVYIYIYIYIYIYMCVVFTLTVNDIFVDDNEVR